MFDLAGLAVAHAWRVAAGGAARRQYDMSMPYVPLEESARRPRDITLLRDGDPVLTYTVAGLKVVGPEPFAAADARGGFFRWAETNFAPDDAEAAIVLKRASLIGLSRGLDLDRYATIADMPGVAPGVLDAAARARARGVPGEGHDPRPRPRSRLDAGERAALSRSGLRPSPMTCSPNAARVSGFAKSENHT